MAVKSLQEFVRLLDAHNELVRIGTYIETELQITEIADRVSKSVGGGKALLFENNGTDFPVLINAMGSHRRMKLVLGVEYYDQIGEQIHDLLKSFAAPKENIIQKLKLLPELKQISSWMPVVVKGRGACQEVVMTEPDITRLPILKCWPRDGGKFVTLPMVNTKDPITGVRNVGMYRMQVFDKTLTGMHWHKHKVGARHYQEYKRLGQKMPVAVALGGDLVNTYAATAPLPDNIDEYMLSGFLRKEKVKLVKCLTQDIEVPADADFIIEGYVDTAEELIYEGPFGDHTGYYSLPDYYPRFHITCITHRKDAIYPTTIVGIPPQEDAYIAKATERIFLAPIKMAMLPEIVDMNIPAEGVAHNLTIVKIEKTYPGQAQKVMNAMWGAGQMMFNKVLVVVDGEVDIHDHNAVLQCIVQKVHPATDIYYSRGPLDVLDHAASKMSFGGKMCIDATSKVEEEVDDNLLDFAPRQFDVEPINEALTGVVASYNTDLLRRGVPAVLLGVDKTSSPNVLAKISLLFDADLFRDIRFVFVVDHRVDITDLSVVAWVLLNNIDPVRDSVIVKQQSGHSALIVDGCRKTLEHDDFKRDWPNIIISDETTINAVDALWPSLGLGEFIASPSIKYRPYVVGSGAAV